MKGDRLSLTVGFRPFKKPPSVNDFAGFFPEDSDPEVILDEVCVSHSCHQHQWCKSLNKLVVQVSNKLSSLERCSESVKFLDAMRPHSNLSSHLLDMTMITYCIPPAFFRLELQEALRY